MTSTTARATTLSPNGAVKPDDWSLPAGKFIASGTTNQDVYLKNGHYSFTATLNYAVYKEAGTGKLDFLYQVESSSKSKNNIQDLKSSNFSVSANQVSLVSLSDAHLTGSVFDLKATDTVKPSVANQSKDGTTVTFSFNLKKGQSTVILAIRTDRTSYTGGSTTVSGPTTLTQSTFAPTPEPASLVLLGGCFAGLAGACGWRRFRKVQPA
jgi:hypothetical protein